MTTGETVLAAINVVFAAATIVLVIITGYYARQTHKQAEAAFKTVEEAAKTRRATEDMAASTTAAAEATAQAAEASTAAADATREMAETANKQLEELRLAREASVWPYLHVNSLVPVPQNEQDPLSNIVLQVSVTNLGPGPALSVRRHIHHPWFIFDPGNDARVIGAGETVDRLLVGRAREYRADPSNQQWEFLIRLEYRDLLGQRWATISPARAGWLETGLVKSIENFSVADEAEEVESVDKHYIRRETVGVDDWWTSVRERDQPLFPDP